MKNLLKFVAAGLLLVAALLPANSLADMGIPSGTDRSKYTKIERPADNIPERCAQFSGGYRLTQGSFTMELWVIRVYMGVTRTETCFASVAFGASNSLGTPLYFQHTYNIAIDGSMLMWTRNAEEYQRRFPRIDFFAPEKPDGKFLVQVFWPGFTSQKEAMEKIAFPPAKKPLVAVKVNN